MITRRGDQKPTLGERGAFSVMYALMITMLLAVAALGMDLGNAFSRKTDTQNQADFAAYDVGQQFATEIASGSGPLTATSPIVMDVAASFNNNQPQDDDSPCWRNDPVDCVQPSQLVNADLADGEVRYTTQGLQVVAPFARINFGFATVFGSSGTSVQSAATVNVFTAGPRVLPMFAVAGCDWGRETLTDPAHTPSPAVPDLEPADNGPADLNLVKVYDSAWVERGTVPVGGAGYHLLVSANEWAKTWRIGFFRDGGAGPEVVFEGPDLKSPADHTTTWPSPGVGPGGVEVPIPTSVTGQEGLWYVRAYGGRDTIGATQNKWSPVNEALPFRVGDELLECASSSTDGNFGTIILPRSIPYNPGDLAANIALGLVDGLNLVKHNGADATGQCEEGVAGANEPDTLPSPDTNCLDTDTGLPANVATAGLVTYNGGNGLLAGKATHDGCDPDGGSDERAIPLGGGPHSTYPINDDTLSCFLLPGKTLAQVTDPGYSGGAAFEADLFRSPRFAYVPIFQVNPDSGGSNRYSIIDFRPAFITDEVAGGDASSDNGLTVDGNYITQVKVVFFSFDALPRDGDIPLIDYLGVGDPIVHLID